MAEPKDWIIVNEPYCVDTDGRRKRYILGAVDSKGPDESYWSFHVSFHTAKGLRTSLPKGHERFWTSSDPPPTLEGRLESAFASFLRLKGNPFPTDMELLLLLAWSGIRVKIGHDLESDFARTIEAPMIRAVGAVFDKDFAKAVVSFCPRPEKC